MRLCGPKATLHFIPTLLHAAQRLASRHSGSVVNRFQSKALMMVTIPGRLGRWVHILNHSAQVIHSTHLVDTETLWLNIVFVLKHLMSKIRENKSNQCFYRALQETRSEGWRMVTSNLSGLLKGISTIPYGYWISPLCICLSFQFLRKYMTSQMTWSSMKGPMLPSLVWPPGSQSLPFPGGISPHQVSVDMQRGRFREWVNPFRFPHPSWDYAYRQVQGNCRDEPPKSVSNKASWFLGNGVFIFTFWVITNQ